MTKKTLLRASVVGLLLSGVLLAVPARVGMVRIEKGTVSLNGRTVSTPQLLEQGSTLVLAEGATVRVQLLGSPAEVSLAGPRTVLIDRANLLKQARAVHRKSLSTAPAPDLGNTTRAAAATARSSASKSAPFRISAPPTKSDSGWSFPVKDGGLFDTKPSTNLVEWTIFSLQMEGSRSTSGPIFSRERVLHGNYTGEQDAIEAPSDKLETGTRYLLSVSILSKNLETELDFYEQPFRLLTEDEKSYLADVEQEMRREAKRTGSVRPLIEIASLLLEWDQLQDAQRVIKEAQSHPRWVTLDSAVREQAERFDSQLKKIWGVQ